MNAAKRWFAVHRKLVTFLAGAVLTICIQVFGTDNPYVSLGILAATGLGIYGVPNVTPPPARAEKTLLPKRGRDISPEPDPPMEDLPAPVVPPAAPE